MTSKELKNLQKIAENSYYSRKLKEKIVIGIAGLIGVIAYNICKTKQEEKEMERIREQREKEIDEMFKIRNEGFNKVNDIFDELESRKRTEKVKED